MDLDLVSQEEEFKILVQKNLKKKKKKRAVALDPEAKIATRAHATGSLKQLRVDVMSMFGATLFSSTNFRLFQLCCSPAAATDMVDEFEPTAGGEPRSGGGECDCNVRGHGATD